MPETNQTSKFFSLNWQDFGKGLVVAVVSAVLTVIATSIDAGNFKFDWTSIWHVALATGVAYLLKNLFTDSKTVVKVLLPLILVLGLLVPETSSAQVFTQPVPKVQGLADQPDSFVCAIRPTVGAAYAFPGNLLMAGTGAGYKRLKWDYEAQKWKSVYSINGILWAAGTTAPGPQIPAFSFGPAVGVLNDLILIGGAYDFTNGKWILALSMAVSLNN